MAHGFNNLLSPILGYSDILLEDFGENENLRLSLLEVKKAAERSRDLTRQLFGFSRKQPLDLKAVDIRKIVTSLEKLLRRALRENIALQIKTCASVCTATADSGQLEQVLMKKRHGIAGYDPPKVACEAFLQEWAARFANEGLVAMSCHLNVDFADMGRSS